MSEQCGVGHLLWEGIGNSGTGLANAWNTCLFFIGLTYGISLLTGNFSQVDKLWSVVPWVYAWILVNDSRTLLMAIVTTVWGLRLSYNFNRRGGYSWPPWSGEEDYRWAILQRGDYIAALKNPVVWHIFNFVFISFYQNVLLLLIATPSMVAHLVASNDKQDCFGNNNHPLNFLDFLAAMILLGLVVVETLADNAQFAFQTEKYRRKNAGEPLDGEYKDGFLQSGLFAICRKPNYAAEQAIWCTYYLFSVAALWTVESLSLTSKLFNASILGCLLLMSLFQGSGHMTEYVTISKYPAYVEYQKQVPLYLPNPFGSGTKSKST
ncbi:DUF1295 domain protein [Seminavis robusta]|uniref:DUF1295 domain protein n=1 Tax=Seminavis robusta TaxID=568900 RepID=A0A9N8DGA3_9STRA|nr:DUF1295 domain protein [Seminavis robusta]|eukprot:Sro111_g055290.1 DUF1295 domain protein (322) ;mRNA; r:59676-60735